MKKVKKHNPYKDLQDVIKLETLRGNEVENGSYYFLCCQAQYNGTLNEN